jgi:transposase
MEEGAMAKELLPDALWARIAPLLPPEPPKPKGGRPRVSDRAALTGILFVLKTGIPWEYLPAEMGCGSGMTCWRRLHRCFSKSWPRPIASTGTRIIPRIVRCGVEPKNRLGRYRWVVEPTLSWLNRAGALSNTWRADEGVGGIPLSPSFFRPLRSPYG